jgi:hypothetical protein
MQRLSAEHHASAELLYRDRLRHSNCLHTAYSCDVMVLHQTCDARIRNPSVGILASIGEEMQVKFSAVGSYQLQVHMHATSRALEVDTVVICLFGGSDGLCVVGGPFFPCSYYQIGR